MRRKESSKIKFVKIVLLAVIGLAILSTSIRSLNAGHSDEPSPALSGHELVSQIAMHEKKLLNLKVQSQLSVERRQPESHKWEPTPVYASCTAWFDGDPNGRARIDVHDQILEWKDGAAPFSQRSYSAAFDGRYGRTAYHRMGPIGQTHESRRAVIFPQAPEILRSRWLARTTGAAFSTFFFFDQFPSLRGKRFSDLLAQCLSQATPPTITWEVLGGTKCIRLTGGDPAGGHESFWLDPARAFALLRYELLNITKNGHKWIVASDTVTKLTEAAPSVWYPVEAYHESMSDPNSERTDIRMHYLASNVVANDPNFDPSIFTMTFPAGYFIEDKVNGVSYRTGSPLEELRQMLDQLVDETIAASASGD
jgi:hypothetical protein